MSKAFIWVPQDLSYPKEAGTANDIVYRGEVTQF